MSVGGHFWGLAICMNSTHILYCALVMTWFTGYMRAQGTGGNWYFSEEVMHCSTE